MNDMKYLYEVACHYKAGNWFRDLDDEITKKVMEKANGVLEKKIAISGSKEADWILHIQGYHAMLPFYPAFLDNGQAG